LVFSITHTRCPPPTSSLFPYTTLFRSPDDHFTAGPDPGVESACSGCTGDVGRNPTVGVRIVSPTGIKLGAKCDSAPDKHFTPGPHCRVSVSWRGRVGDTGGYPLGVRTGSKSATGAHKKAFALPGPDNHFVAGPNSRVVV